MKQFVLLLSVALPSIALADGEKYDTISAIVGFEEAFVDGFDSSAALGVGVEGTKGINENLYIGGYLANYLIVMELENSDNFVKGTLAGFGLFLGGEMPATDRVSIVGEVEFSTATSDLTYYYPNNSVDLDMESTSGAGLFAGLAYDADFAVFTAGASKGISGDYEDHDPSASLEARFGSDEGVFGGFIMSLYEDSQGIEFSLGTHY